VLLFGGDGGHRNLGDQAMLINTVARLRRIWPDCTITALATKPDRLPKLDRVEARAWPAGVFVAQTEPSPLMQLPGMWRLWRGPSYLAGQRFVSAARTLARTGAMPAGATPETRELLDLFQNSDLIVNYGSGGLNDIWCDSTVYRWSFCYLAARALGKRMIVTGQGIGPLGNALDRKLLCSALDHVDAITVRDFAASAAFLRENGVRRPPVQIAADDAASLRPAPGEEVLRILSDEGVPSDRPLIAFQFRDTAFDRSVGDHDRGLMAAVADTLIEQTNGRIVFVSTVYNEERGVDDRAAAAAIVARMKRADRVTVLQGLYDPPTVKGIIADADLAVGTSYHFLVFALTTGVPPVALYTGEYYRGKIRGLFDHFELADATFDMEMTRAEAVARWALSALADRPAISARLTETAGRLEKALDDVWRQVQQSMHEGERATANRSFVTPDEEAEPLLSTQ
jgi:polysaccharide pyruvyl transferase WcaK-like protein